VRVQADIDVNAPATAIWEAVTDPVRMIHVLDHVTRWDQIVPPWPEPAGLGTRYRMLMRVRSAEVGGEIEVVEWDPGRDMAWTSVTGVDQRGRIRLRERVPGRTHVELRFAGGVAGGGLGGWLAEKVAAPTIKSSLDASLVLLKPHVEYEERRRAAERRREAAVRGR
jgi:uncharacterized membrane protein